MLLSVLLTPAGFSQISTAYSEIPFFINGKPPLSGADAALFPDSPFRFRIDLSGSWEFSTDRKGWNKVDIPGCYDYSGEMVFQRSFEIKSEQLDKFAFLLVALGVNYQSEISVNGNFIGRHTGGATSFVFSIPNSAMQVGPENSINVAVNSELRPRTTLPLKQQVGGWKTYGGIFRDIYILAVPKIFIEDAVASTTFSADMKNAKLTVKMDLTDRWSGLKAEPGTSIACQVELYDKLSNEIAGKSSPVPFTPKANKTVFASAEIQIAEPKLWSPETPDLYSVKCQIVKVTGKDIVVADEFTFDHGFREFKWAGGKLNLNGKAVQIKGILWREDHETFGASLSPDLMERDIASIKTLGANLVRFLYPPHPYVLNLCDRYGLMVFEEIPLGDVPAEILSKDYFQELATNYAKEMVLRDRRHVSVLGWGVGNEFEGRGGVECEFINGLRNVIKSLDKRSVYFATRIIDNQCFEYVDLIALNDYGSDPKLFKGSLQSCLSRYPGKPVIVARYGIDVEGGNHNGYSDPFSMESHARYAMLFYNMMKETKIAGSIFWSYNDWRSDRPSLVTRSPDPFVVSMGLVGLNREKRTAFEVTRALFNEEKVHALPVGNYSSNTPIIYVVSGFLMLILFAFMYNANRRFRDSVNRSLFRTYNFFADVRDQRIISNLHSVLLGVIIAVTLATVTSSIVSHYRSNLLFDNMLGQFLPDEVKGWLVRMVWNPAEFILVFSGLVMLKLLVAAFVIKFFSMLVKTRVTFYHSFSVSIWSSLPFAVLIPVSMILFRLMETEFYIVPVFVMLGIIGFWVVLRLLKGISIIYDIYAGKVYALGFLMIVLLLIIVYGYLDYTQSTSLYMKYLLQSAR